MIEKILKNKTSKEKAKIKSQELAKVKLSTFKKDDFDIEIVGDITNVDNHIEFYAKAFQNGKQLGFGKDGTTELEHFIIHNPPVLVDDPNGEIVREWTDNITKEKKQRKLKYDPQEALKQSLTHTISLVAKDGKDIIKGKVGNTTSTFYSASGDGVWRRDDANETWTNIWAGTGNGSTGSATTQTHTPVLRLSTLTTSDRWDRLYRGYFPYDTSALSGQQVDSATLSIWGVEKPGDSFSTSFCIYTATGSSYSGVGGTTSASNTSISYASFSVSGYNDYTLNATGNDHINTAGTSHFSFRSDHDGTNTPPTWTSNGLVEMDVYLSENTGTDKDPKLVVVHSSVTTDNSIFFGCNF